MYVAITSPYLRNWGVTLWYQSLGLHLVWVNHLGQSSGSYEQYSQVQINWSVSEFGDSSNEYKNTMTLTIPSLTRLYSFLPYNCQPEHPISFSVSLHRLASHPFGLVLYHTSPSWVPYRYQSAQRKCRGPVTIRFLECQSCSHTWMEIARTQFFVRWGEM